MIAAVKMKRTIYDVYSTKVVEYYESVDVVALPWTVSFHSVYYYIIFLTEFTSILCFIFPRSRVSRALQHYPNQYHTVQYRVKWVGIINYYSIRYIVLYYF